MHEKLESIKPLLKAGEYKKAVDALKEYQTEFPDDWDGKLMEGIIAKLRGDEETFRRIHDEALAIMDKHGAEGRRIKASSLWGKYRSAWEKVAKMTVIGLVAVGVAGGTLSYLSSSFRNRVKWCIDVIMFGIDAANSKNIIRTLYDGPSRELYDGPEYYENKQD